MNDTFDNAHFYSWTDRETLTSEDPEDEIRDFLDWSRYTFKTDSETIQNMKDGLEITAYNPREISDSVLDEQALSLVEDFLESLDEEYGNPDGDSTDLISEENEEALVQEIFAVLKKFRDDGRIVSWQCEPVAKRTYTPEEITQWVKKQAGLEEARSYAFWWTHYQSELLRWTKAKRAMQQDYYEYDPEEDDPEEDLLYRRKET